MPSVCSFSGAETTATSHSVSSRSSWPVSPAQASPQSRDASRPGHRRPATTKRAEQVPRAPADVPEADEPDVRVAQGAGLRDGRVVHRRSPYVAAQLSVLSQDAAAQHDPRRNHILRDGPLMVKRVGHQDIRRQGVELDLVGACPGNVNQPHLGRGSGHLGGETASHVHIGVPQFVERHAAHDARDTRTLGGTSGFEPLAVRHQIDIGN